MKQIMFARQFPEYHPKAREPTYFVEKIWDAIGDVPNNYSEMLPEQRLNYIRLGSEFIWAKHHTIRSGNRFKIGDWFAPKVWSGLPYKSKTIPFAPPIEVKKVWDIGLMMRGDFKEFYCGECDLTATSINELAKNDGLSVNDLFNWFNKPFEGQIICWNEKINY